MSEHFHRAYVELERSLSGKLLSWTEVPNLTIFPTLRKPYEPHASNYMHVFYRVG